MGKFLKKILPIALPLAAGFALPALAGPAAGLGAGAISAAPSVGAVLGTGSNLAFSSGFGGLTGAALGSAGAAGAAATGGPSIATTAASEAVSGGAGGLFGSGGALAPSTGFLGTGIDITGGDLLKGALQVGLSGQGQPPTPGTPTIAEGGPAPITDVPIGQLTNPGVTIGSIFPEFGGQATEELSPLQQRTNLASLGVGGGGLSRSPEGQNAFLTSLLGGEGISDIGKQFVTSLGATLAPLPEGETAPSAADNDRSRYANALSRLINA